MEHILFRKVVLLQDITLVLLTAGDSSRFAQRVKKQWLYQGDTPLWLKVARDFEEGFDFREIIVVGKDDEIDYMSRFGDYNFVAGGNTRQESLKNALEFVSSGWVMVSDVARCCVDRDLISRVVESINKASCIAPAIEVSDTAYYDSKPVAREKLKLIQTPQLSRTEVLKKAIEIDDFTDESSAIWRFNQDVLLVPGSKNAHKLTFASDLRYLECLTPPSSDSFVGIGLDIHQFEEGKKMLLGGVEIDVDFGFEAHSDGDVAIHSLIDALLGAIGDGDIGELFPDSDEKYRGIDSKELLKIVVDRVYSRGFVIKNIDMTINAQKPKISKYKNQIAKKLSEIIEIPTQKINIKATTSEKMGFVGRGEGVAVESIVSVKYYDWRELI